MQSEKLLDLFRRAVSAGICIAIGGVVFLGCDNKYVGAVLFSVGLFAVVTRGMALYTGMVGYLPDNCNPDYIGRLLVVIAGNLVGTGVIGLGLHLTRQTALCEKAAEMCAVKTGDSLLSLLVLGIGCGILMYIAVDGYRRFTDPLTKILGVFLCVPVFILAGMEHSIADMFYFFAGSAWSLRTVICVAVIIIGNGIGGVLIPLLRPGK
ncbi:formate/nitrite transporter family protein [Butyricicoccus sp.]|uniref:formate/nitrite transporter family protein n=1 Tax=Butyricicoccus sp. TaxID=2049021 RepID=UPI003F15B848